MKKLQYKKPVILSHYLRGNECIVSNHKDGPLCRRPLVNLIRLTNQKSIHLYRIFYIDDNLNLYNYNKRSHAWFLWV